MYSQNIIVNFESVCNYSLIGVSNNLPVKDQLFTPTSQVQSFNLSWN